MQQVDSSYNSPPEKLLFLEGLRGLMAINVLLCHFVCVYYPEMYFLDFAEKTGGVLSLFATTPASVLVNGNIAVQFFFVLTGLLVGKTFFTQKIRPEELPTRMFKRYKRLLPVICATTIYTFLTMVLGWQKHLVLADLVKNPDFLREYCNFTPTIVSLLRSIFLNPFNEMGSAYVGPFWTIRYEFWGYILSMAICLIFRERKTRRIEYVLVAIVCLFHLGANYVAFVIGIFIADLQYNDNASVFEKLFSYWIRRRESIWLILLAGIYCATCPLSFTSIHSVFNMIPYISSGIVRAAGVSMILFAIFHLPRMQKLLSSSWLALLGSVSFEVYAIHWPLMLSFEIWLFSLLLNTFSYDTAAILGFIITIPVIYLSAYIMKICLHWIGEIEIKQFCKL